MWTCGANRMEAVEKMDRNEKLLLLQMILEDIRGNWNDYAGELSKRVYAAYDIAKELELHAFIESIEDFHHMMSEGDADGRHFRKPYNYGGYMNMEEIHGLEPKFFGRSEQFQRKALALLTYPDSRFNDWGEDVE